MPVSGSTAHADSCHIRCLARRWWLWVLAALALSIGAWVARVRLLPERFQPKQFRADVLLVPSGDPEERRTRRAVELLKEGVAPRILISGAGAGGDSAHFLARIAVDLGALPEQILVEPTARTTMENFTKSLPILKAMGAQRIIVVTQASHARRAAYLAENALSGIEVRVVSVHSRQDIATSMREAAKLAVSAVRGDVAVSALYE